MSACRLNLATPPEADQIGRKLCKIIPTSSKISPVVSNWDEQLVDYTNYLFNDSSNEKVSAN